MKSRPLKTILPQPGTTKAEIREHTRGVLSAMSHSFRQEASQGAIALLLKQKLWKDAQTVLLYAPLPEELDIWPLLSEALGSGKIVALPRYIAEKNLYAACPITDPARDLKIGQFGIREPALHCMPMAISRLDLVLVPGVAFDLHGRRLGRGRGFYDQLLKIVLGKTCGVAFDEQIVKAVPVEPHDVLVNCMLTPTRWVEV